LGTGVFFAGAALGAALVGFLAAAFLAVGLEDMRSEEAWEGDVWRQFTH
jgi:hypothetical protein